MRDVGSRRCTTYPKTEEDVEGGLEPVGDARMKFDILYYVIGILYLIFDLEIIFLFPLATVLFSLGSLLAFGVVMIFLIILTIGFLYEWFHGALEIVLFSVLDANFVLLADN
jgi:NADH-quinone oxidoreductase subunit A